MEQEKEQRMQRIERQAKAQPDNAEAQFRWHFERLRNGITEAIFEVLETSRGIPSRHVAKALKETGLDYVDLKNGINHLDISKNYQYRDQLLQQTAIAWEINEHVVNDTTHKKIPSDDKAKIAKAVLTSKGNQPNLQAWIFGSSGLQDLDARPCSNLIPEDLNTIKYCTKLRTLRLHAEQLDESIWERLSKAPQLQELEVQHSNLTGEGLKEDSLHELKTLHLESKNITQAGLQAICTLPKLQKLHLVLFLPGFDPEAFKAFTLLKSDTEVTLQLHLHDRELNQTTLELLNSHPGIKILRLTGTKTPDLRNFKNCHRLPVELNYRDELYEIPQGNKTGPIMKGLEASDLENIHEIPHLKSVSLHSRNPQDEIIEELIHLSPQTEVELDLMHPGEDDPEYFQEEFPEWTIKLSKSGWLNIGNIKGLKTLRINGAFPGFDPAIDGLEKHEGQEQLTELLEKIRTNTQLKELSLTNIPFPPSSWEKLKQLPLEKLELVELLLSELDPLQALTKLKILHLIGIDRDVDIMKASLENLSSVKNLVIESAKNLPASFLTQLGNTLHQTEITINRRRYIEKSGRYLET